MTVLAIVSLALSGARLVLPGSVWKPPKPQVDFGNALTWISIATSGCFFALAVWVVIP